MTDEKWSAANTITSKSWGTNYPVCQFAGCNHLAITQIAVPIRYEIPFTAQGKINLCHQHARLYRSLSITGRVKVPLQPHRKRKI